MIGHRVLIIGVGSIGERHLRCFHATGRCEVGLVEPNKRLRVDVAQRYNVKYAFGEVGEALGEGFDVAVVAAPAHLHIPIATKLVETGIHPLIEKPLSTSLDGNDSLKKLVAQKRVTAGVGYTYRASPALAAMREAMREGRFGEPREVVVMSGQHFPSFRPAYRDVYYKDRKTGGGAIQDAITHLVNAAEWLVGPIDRLAYDAAHQALEGVTVEDTVHMFTRHGTVMGSLQLNQYQFPNEIFITVVCQKGVARFEAHKHRWRWTDRVNESWHDEEFGKLERDTLYIKQADAFLDAVEGKRPVACTIEEAEQTLRVNLAALASADHGALTPVS